MRIEQDHEEDVAHRRGVAHVERAERLLVDVVAQRLGRVGGSALGHDEDQVEDLEGADRPEHRDEHDVGRSSGTVMWKNDCEGEAPSSAAASLISTGMSCNPARKRIMNQPNRCQIVTSTSAGSATLAAPEPETRRQMERAAAAR